MSGTAGETSQILFFDVSGSVITDFGGFDLISNLLLRLNFELKCYLSLQDQQDLTRVYCKLFALVLVLVVLFLVP